MSFIELAAIDNDRYIIYGEDNVATFDDDNIAIINLNTLTKMHPESKEFEDAINRIGKCLPNILIRLADSEDIEFFDELSKYLYHPTQVTGFDLKEFILDMTDPTVDFQIKEAFDNLDIKEADRLNEYFNSAEDIKKLEKNLKELDGDPDKVDNFLDEIMDDVSSKSVYEIAIMDMLSKNSPLEKIIRETFDLAKDDALRKKLDPLMKKTMGDAYKNVYFGGKADEYLYIFTDVKLKRAKVKWWPNTPLDKEEWEKFYRADADFKTTINNFGLRPKNSRLWKVSLMNLSEEKEMLDIIESNSDKLRGHEMKKAMGPWFKDELGSDYLDIFVEPGSQEDRKLYIFVEPGSKSIKSKWWPKKPISTKRYDELVDLYKGFKDIDNEIYDSGD